MDPNFKKSHHEHQLDHIHDLNQAMHNQQGNTSHVVDLHVEYCDKKSKKAEKIANFKNTLKENI